MKKAKFGKLKPKYKGKIFSISQREITFPDGVTETYEYCKRAPSVSVLAFNEKNEILMIKERRHGYHKNIWFLPGGRADQPKDTPRTAALRELEEEAGYKAKQIKMIHKKSHSNTLLWDIYIFYATDLKFVGNHPERGEHIESTQFIPFKKAVKMALDGTIENEFISYNIIRFDQMLKNKKFKIK